MHICLSAACRNVLQPRLVHYYIPSIYPLSTTEDTQPVIIKLHNLHNTLHN